MPCTEWLAFRSEVLDPAHQLQRDHGRHLHRLHPRRLSRQGVSELRLFGTSQGVQAFLVVGAEDERGLEFCAASIAPKIYHGVHGAT